MEEVTIETGVEPGELLSIVVDQFFELATLLDTTSTGASSLFRVRAGGLPSPNPWHVLAQYVTQIDSGLVNRGLPHGRIELKLVAM